LLRPKEVCQRLDISYPTLWRWIKAGRIGAVRTESGRYLVPEEEVERIMRERRGSLESVLERFRSEFLDWVTGRSMNAVASELAKHIYEAIKEVVKERGEAEPSLVKVLDVVCEMARVLRELERAVEESRK
jgi:excisionase family DNA binding protein